MLLHAQRGTLIRRTEMQLRLGSGPALFARGWLPEAPERTVILVHGFGEHSGRYETLGAWLADRGASVVAYDQRGHGQTPGHRGHADVFDDFVVDLRAVIERVTSESPDIPLFVVGHSMGGLVVARLAILGCDAVDAYVLSGPLIALAAKVSPVKARMSQLLRRIAPRFQLEAGVLPEWLSHDQDVVLRYRDDPLVHGKMSLALAAGIIATQKRVLAEAARVSAPMLLLHGEDDRLCAPAGSADFFAGLAAQIANVSELVVLPGLYHEIFNELEREAVFLKLHTWLCATGGSRRR